MDLDPDVLVRLLVGVALGAVIGAEREASSQPAGLRTHIAVSLGAALFGVISTLGFAEFEAARATTNIQVDVTRVASQVVVGIGFLGAGVIFRERTSVRNLTTAASLWATAAVGLAVGVGDLATGTIAAILLITTLIALRPARALLRRVAGPPASRLLLAASRVEIVDGALDDLRRHEGMVVDRVLLTVVDGQVRVRARMRAEPAVVAAALDEVIRSRPAIESADCEAW